MIGCTIDLDCLNSEKLSWNMSDKNIEMQTISSIKAKNMINGINATNLDNGFIISSQNDPPSLSEIPETISCNSSADDPFIITIKGPEWKQFKSVTKNPTKKSKLIHKMGLPRQSHKYQLSDSEDSLESLF